MRSVHGALLGLRLRLLPAPESRRSSSSLSTTTAPPLVRDDEVVSTARRPSRRRGDVAGAKRRTSRSGDAPEITLINIFARFDHFSTGAVIIHILASFSKECLSLTHHAWPRGGRPLIDLARQTRQVAVAPSAGCRRAMRSSKTSWRPSSTRIEDVRRRLFWRRKMRRLEGKRRDSY